MLRTGLGLPGQTPAEKAQQQIDIYRAEHGPIQTPEQKAQQQIDIYRAQHGPIQTPEQKAQQQVDTFKKKQEAKTTMVTPGFATENQKTLLAIKNTIPMLEELKTMAPDQVTGRYLHPINQRDYETQRTLILDKLMASLKVPKNSEPYLKLEQALSRGLADTDESYANRVDKIIKELKAQGLNTFNAASVLKSAPGNESKPDLKSMSTADLLKLHQKLSQGGA
jgi:hypothetical protein